MTFALFCFALLIVGVVFAGCIYIFAVGIPEDKKWAAGIVSAIVSGLIGFLVGQGEKISSFLKSVKADKRFQNGVGKLFNFRATQ